MATAAACGRVPAGIVVLALACTVLRPSSAAADPYRWPQPEGFGSPLLLTYSYSTLLDPAFDSGLSSYELRAATEEALGLWALYAPLHFVERRDSGPLSTAQQYDPRGHPSIRIGFDEYGTSPDVLAHAFLPLAVEWSGLAGDIHLNPEVTWDLATREGAIDVLEVLTHEIGHALGIVHLLWPDAIMGPIHGGWFSGLGTGFLLPPDIAAIRGIYGTGVGGVYPIPEPGTLLLILGGLAAGSIVRRRAARQAGAATERSTPGCPPTTRAASSLRGAAPPS